MKLKNRLQAIYWQTFPHYIYTVYKAYRAGVGIPVPKKLKIRTIEEYARRFELKVFVETGTYKGDTIQATRHLFDEVHSIELSERLASDATLRFTHDPRITIHQGDSGEKLSQVLSNLTRPTLFWLDAHYSAGVTARGELDSPIMQELDAIINHGVHGHMILIDDAREFTGDNGYPTIDQLYDFVIEKMRGWRILAYNDVIRIWHPDPE
ncbi:MAG: hypothetical protein SGI88_21400 [Candidatus Hydrogenedentes bacterium]|nr:hypothetical protein [Candidatus Hydrogenedentota bacterium]